MSSASQTSSITHIYPSDKEDVRAYLNAVRLASSVRNKMDSEKATAKDKRTPVDADSYGRHHPEVEPPSSHSPATKIDSWGRHHPSPPSADSAMEVDAWGRHHPPPPSADLAINADSYGRHHPKFTPSLSADPTGVPQSIPTPSPTSSARFPLWTRKPSLVQPRDSYQLDSHSMSTGICLPR